MAAFRQAVSKGMELADQTEEYVQASPTLEMLTPASLSIVCFRVNPADMDLDEESLEAINRKVLAHVFWDDQAFVSSTLLHGKFSLRMCIVNHTTTWDDVRKTLEAIERFVRFGVRRPLLIAAGHRRSTCRPPAGGHLMCVRLERLRPTRARSNQLRFLPRSLAHTPLGRRLSHPLAPPPTERRRGIALPQVAEPEATTGLTQLGPSQNFRIFALTPPTSQVGGQSAVSISVKCVHRR